MWLSVSWAREPSALRPIASQVVSVGARARAGVVALSLSCELESTRERALGNDAGVHVVVGTVAQVWLVVIECVGVGTPARV